MMYVLIYFGVGMFLSYCCWQYCNTKKGSKALDEQLTSGLKAMYENANDEQKVFMIANPEVARTTLIIIVFVCLTLGYPYFFYKIGMKR